MNKIICIGKGDYGYVYCNIEYKDKKLSISGVEGPKSNGDARGSSGQILDHININQFEDGWDQDLLNRFIKAWSDWHLNDMRAACEHQRKEKWGEKKLTIVSYRLDDKILEEQRSIKKQYEKRLKDGETVTLTEKERETISLSYSLNLPEFEPIPYGYSEKSRETKTSGWMHEKDHPEGVLSKPCPICGYKYGTAWLFEEIPQDVINFLKSLPESTRKPAWI